MIYDSTKDAEAVGRVRVAASNLNAALAELPPDVSFRGRAVVNLTTLAHFQHNMRFIVDDAWRLVKL